MSSRPNKALLFVAGIVLVVWIALSWILPLLGLTLGASLGLPPQWLPLGAFLLALPPLVTAVAARRGGGGKLATIMVVLSVLVIVAHVVLAAFARAITA